MNVQVLRSFLTVAQCRSFTQAAKLLNFTQPTISNHIASLEGAYRASFFNRAGKSLYLTQAGQAFLPLAQRLLQDYQDSVEVMSRFQAKERSLQLAVSAQFINFYLLPVLRQLGQEYPDLRIRVDRRLSVAETLEEAFGAQKYDFALVHLEAQPLYTQRLKLWRQQLVWVASRELYQQLGCSQDIYAYPYIGYGSNAEYQNLLRAKVDFGRLRQGLDFNDAEAVLAAVRQGLGLAVLPLLRVEGLLGPEGPLVQLGREYSVELPVSLLYDLRLDLADYKARFLELVGASL